MRWACSTKGVSLSFCCRAARRDARSRYCSGVHNCSHPDGVPSIPTTNAAAVWLTTNRLILPRLCVPRMATVMDKLQAPFTAFDGLIPRSVGFEFDRMIKTLLLHLSLAPCNLMPSHTSASKPLPNTSGNSMACSMRFCSLGRRLFRDVDVASDKLTEAGLARSTHRGPPP